VRKQIRHRFQFVNLKAGGAGASGALQAAPSIERESTPANVTLVDVLRTER
jgi:hypothetical protein